MADGDDDICEVRITAPELGWLVDHTRRLVEDRLVACGQHEATVRSIYRWQGAVEDDTEARVALHTQRRHVPEIVRRTTDAHPDEVPGIIVVPVLDGHPDYLRWVRAETDPGG
jgi:periplasmic divalent cation tolerance protein